MGDRRAHDPASETWWAQTVGERARGAEWNLLHPVDGMPMEGAAERSAAKEYSARLSGAVELGWHVRAHPPRALCRGARAGRTWGKSDGSDHRLANREGYAKRGAWLDPSGYDAGKKIKGRKRHILVYGRSDLERGQDCREVGECDKV